MQSMSEVFQLLKEGKMGELTYLLDRECVCNEVEYDVPVDVYWGLQEHLKCLPFIGTTYTFGENPSISFMYNGRKFKINKQNIYETCN